MISLSKEKKVMERAILFLLISSLMLLCAVFDSVDSALAKSISFIGGLLFFLFLLLGYVMFYRFSSARKQNSDPTAKRNGKPGMIVFFSHPLAKKADIVMIISFVISLVMLIIGQVNDAIHGNFLFNLISVLSSAVFIFAIQMHAILNGVNYRYYMELKKSE